MTSGPPAPTEQETALRGEVLAYFWAQFQTRGDGIYADALWATLKKFGPRLDALGPEGRALLERWLAWFDRDYQNRGTLKELAEVSRDTASYLSQRGEQE